jgi:hypothetical protein
LFNFAYASLPANLSHNPLHDCLLLRQQDYIIKTKVPARPAGQMDILQFAADCDTEQDRAESSLADLAE